MHASKNSANSRIFKVLAYASAILIAAAIAITAARWSFAHGYVLNDGDAEANYR
jgi:hypothetical protein